AAREGRREIRGVKRGGSEPGPPVTWASVKVHDRDDVDTVRLDAVQETVRKFGDEKTPESAAERRAGGWKFRESFVRLLHGNELLSGFGMKLDASHRSVERAFLTTVSAGISAILPDLSSPRRRSASWSQSFSTSVSNFGTRLEMRRCARRARSLRGSFRALDSSSCAGLLMAEGSLSRELLPFRGSSHRLGRPMSDFDLSRRRIEPLTISPTTHRTY